MATPRQRLVVALCVLGAACTSTSPPAHPDAAFLPQDVGLLVAESDGEPGGALIEAIDPSTHTLVQHSGTAFDENSRLRRIVDPRSGAERVFLVGVATGQLTEVASNGAIVSQWSVLDDGGAGQGASPRDVAIASDGAFWITRSGLPTLRVLEPDGRPRRSVDLSAFAPPDAAPGVAGMTAIAIVGGTAYVALARRSSAATLPHDAQIVAIDTATYAASLFVEVPMRAPVDRFALEATDASPRLWLACAGDADPATHRGLVAVDVDARTVATTFDWTSLGLSPVALAIAGTHEAFALASASASGGTPTTALIGLDPGTPGAALQTIYRSPDTPRLVDLAIANDVVFVADGDAAAPGILVFDRFDGARRGVISTAVPPLALLVLRPPP